MAKRSQLLVGTIFDAFDPQTTSIEFNGSDEAMRDQSQVAVGIANVWSIGIWIRRRSDTQGLTQNNTILQIFGSGPPNRSRIFVRGNGQNSNDPIEVEITTSGGSNLKRYSWNVATFPFDVWFQMIIVWDGTNLTMYKDGVLVAQDTTTNNGSGTMADNNRLIQIGQNGGVQPFSGWIHSIAIWDVDVAAGASTIYNSGVASSRDLSKNSGDYTFASNLQHWWRLGQDASDLGKDSGNASLLRDVNTNSLNIDASDIDSESPL
jgi:hypothetical protein